MKGAESFGLLYVTSLPTQSLQLCSTSLGNMEHFVASRISQSVTPDPNTYNSREVYDPNSTSPSEACLLFLSKRFNALRPSYITLWWANLELNQDSTDYESVALPLSYWPNNALTPCGRTVSAILSGCQTIPYISLLLCLKASMLSTAVAKLIISGPKVSIL